MEKEGAARLKRQVQDCPGNKSHPFLTMNMPCSVLPRIFDKIWGHPYCKLSMQRAHHPHTSNGYPILVNACLSLLAGVDNSNELQLTNKIMNANA